MSTTRASCGPAQRRSSGRFCGRSQQEWQLSGSRTGKLNDQDGGALQPTLVDQVYGRYPAYPPRTCHSASLPKADNRFHGNERQLLPHRYHICSGFAAAPVERPLRRSCIAAFVIARRATKGRACLSRRARRLGTPNLTVAAAQHVAHEPIADSQAGGSTVGRSLVQRKARPQAYVHAFLKAAAQGLHRPSAATGQANPSETFVLLAQHTSKF